MQISAGKQNLCIFNNLMIAKLYIYTNLKNFFWKVQHFGVLDCVYSVYSEGIFCGVKNPAEMGDQKSSERNGNVKS